MPQVSNEGTRNLGNSSNIPASLLSQCLVICTGLNKSPLLALTAPFLI